MHGDEVAPRLRGRERGLPLRIRNAREIAAPELGGLRVFGRLRAERECERGSDEQRPCDHDEVRYPHKSSRPTARKAGSVPVKTSLVSACCTRALPWVGAMISRGTE